MTYYQATRKSSAEFSSLQGSQHAKVCVVGGGYAGLTTALGLLERGEQDVLLLEASQIGSGASGRNGGFVFSGYSKDESVLLKQLGQEHAKRIFARSIAAIHLIRYRIQSYQIDCDMVDEGVLWTNWFKNAQILQQRAEILQNIYGVQWDFIDTPQLKNLLNTKRYSQALWERNAFHLHPLNYAQGLAQVIQQKGGRVFIQSPAVKVQPQSSGFIVHSTTGQVHCEQLVLACGGYLSGLYEEIDQSILPIATYVMTTEPLQRQLMHLFPGTRAAVYDTRFAFDYYRPLQDTRLLWGGRISILDRSPEAVARLLKKDALKVFPTLENTQIEYAWSGLMSYARHQMPQILKLAPHLWCAQGFGGHGLATTTVAGELISAAIATGDDAYLDYQQYNLTSAWKPLGFLAAQSNYAWYQWRDWLRDLSERLWLKQQTTHMGQQ